MSGFQSPFLTNILILPISQFQTLQLMASQTRSRIEYLMETLKFLS